MRFLADREPDPTRARLPGIDPVVADKALEMIWYAFGIPKAQQYCLRPDDNLQSLYDSIYSGRRADCMDFETLMFLLERAMARPLTKAEFESALTVGGLMRLLASTTARLDTR